MRLKNQVAVITGGASGIGRAIAVCFAAEGARVVVADVNEADGQETVHRIEKAGGEALAVHTDVGDADSVARLFETLDRRDWPVDILVNNAGNAEGSLTPMWETSDEQWDSIMAVHLRGTFYCAREALRRMVPRKSGAIINLGSVAGLGGLPGACSYTAAKGGIIALTKGMSQECGPVGIRVNCIAPGWIQTPMLDHLPEEWRKGMAKSTPLERVGTPEEVAGVALFLASDDSSFITGQIISPNGGMYR